MNVPLLDLTPQNEQLREEILHAVTAVIDSNRYILGPEVAELEEEAASYCGARFGVGVSSGTDALIVTLMALGIGPGDQVLTTPYSFFATMGSILRVGAVPVFVDIDPVTMNLDPEQAAIALQKDRRSGGNIKAILPVHLFGQCADMRKIMALAEEYDLRVIEDAAQGIGADCPFGTGEMVTWKRAGSIGHAGCFSFFPSKNLGCAGDGGLVTTNDEELAAKLKIFRNHGADPKYYHSVIGGNFRLDTIQAAVLKVKLPHLEKWHQQRRENSERYRALFQESGLVDNPVILPEAIFQDSRGAERYNYHIYNQFVIRTPRREQLRAFLTDHRIGCEVYYPLCLHQQKCLEQYGVDALSFPAAENAAARSLALPIYPGLSEEQQRYVVDMISGFFQAN